MTRSLAVFDPAPADVAARAPSRSAATLPQSVRHLCGIALVALATGCTTFVANPTSSVPDQGFVAGAATSGANEIAAARVAQQKATDPMVRAYAAQMIEDHTAANKQLKAIVSTKGVSVGEAPDAEHVAIVSKMSAMSGAEFDRAYMQQQVVDHQKTVALFDAEASNGTDNDIRSFAATTLPILRQHLQMAQQYAGRSATGR